MNSTFPYSKVILDNMPVGVILVDENHEVYFQNKYITNLFTTDEEVKSIISEKIIMCPFNFKECKTRSEEVFCHSCSLSHHLNANPDNLEVSKFVISKEMKSDDKKYFKITLQMAPLEDNIYLFIMVEDITSDEVLKKELYISSITDRLTGLYNRHYLDTQMDSYVKQSKLSPLSVILFDIDFFKKVNDTYGHIVGDDLLIELSQLLKNCSRTSDVLVRYGGEEIISILPDTDEKTAITIAENIRYRIKDTVFTSKNISITISGGISTYRKGESATECIDRADKRLYLAKQSGRDRIISQAMLLVQDEIS